MRAECAISAHSRPQYVCLLILATNSLPHQGQIFLGFGLTCSRRIARHLSEQNRAPVLLAMGSPQISHLRLFLTA
jgi:hypothetical protein